MSGNAMHRESDIPVYEMVCDICLAPNSVRWTYITDNNATEEEWRAHRDDPSWRQADGGPIFYMTDPRWAVCQVCHELIQVNNRNALFTRAMHGHRQRKRTHMAEMLAMGRGDPVEVQRAMNTANAMEAMKRESPALALAADMALASDLTSLIVGFMRYRHRDPIPEPYNAVDRVLGTRWEHYTADGTWPLLPVDLPKEPEPDATFQVQINDITNGGKDAATVMIDGEHNR